MTRLKKIAAYFSIVVIGFIALLIGGGYWWLAQSLPKLEGNVWLPKLLAPANIDTDNHGIPVITAGSRIDAARVLGYTTARDRLFQMDLMRRKSAGRLAEIFGEMAVSSDTQARIYGYNVKAQQVLQRLPILHADYLQAYADGVNSYLQQNAPLSFEFKALGYQPEPWKATDSLLIVFGMFENLTAWSERGERMMTVMAQTLPNEVTAFLTPDTDRFTDELMKYTQSLRPAQSLPLQAMLAAVPDHFAGPEQLADLSPGETLAGSNAWAVSGRKTADGRAILANDMHLGIGVPNIWYRVELNYPQVRAAGLILPGTPFLIAGSNQHVAWGMTNLAGDFLDLVKLEVNPNDAGQYKLGDHWKAFDERHELIQVKDAEPRSLLVKETQWGPVAEKPLLGQPVAIHWAALDADAVNVDILELEQSTTLQQAMAIANRSGGPQLNVLLADEQGHIAWTLTGKIPKRFGGDGLVSRSWANGKTGWQAYLSADEMPRIVDPAEGFLVSANERRFAANFPYVIGHQFASGYRAYRIDQRLKQSPVHSEWSLFNLQQDTETEFYGYYQQLALQVLTAEVLASKPKLVGLRDYLLSWNGRADVGSLGLPVIIEFRKQLIDTVFAPFLAACKQADSQFIYSWNYVDTPLQTLLNDRPQPLLASIGQYPSWDSFILARLEASADKVRADNPGVAWTNLNWGMQNKVGHAHPFSKAIPWLATVLNMPKLPLAGCGGFCVRATGPEYGASERLVVSPGYLQAGILHMPGGQSGHPLSDYYMDQQPFWLAGLPLPLLAGTSEHTLLLHPQNEAKSQ